MAYKSIQTFSLPSAYQQQVAEANRRQQLADMMRQQAVSPLESQMVSGRVVPTSPLLALSKMLEGYMGGKFASQAEETKAAANQADIDNAIRLMSGMPTSQKVYGEGPAVGLTPDQAGVINLDPQIRKDAPKPQGMNIPQTLADVMAMPEAGSGVTKPAPPPQVVTDPRMANVPVSQNERLAYLMQGMRGGPVTQAMATNLMNQKPASVWDYVQKPTLGEGGLDPASFGTIQADLNAGRIPDPSKLKWMPKPQAPHVYETIGKQWDPATNALIDIPGFKPKEPASSELGRLLRERDALPEGSPARRDYDRAIQKATTRADTGQAAGPALGGLDPETIKVAAVVVAADPKLITNYSSIGKAGQPIKAAIQNEITNNLKQAGMTAQDLVSLRASAKANAASATKLQAQANAVDAFEGLAKNNGERVLELIEKLDQGGIPLTEGLIRSTKRQMGDADAAELRTVLTTFIAESSRILSNPNMTGVVSDSARHEVENMVPENLTAVQARRVIKRLFTEMDVRKHYTNEALSHAYQGTNVFRNPQANPQTPEPTAMPPQAALAKLTEGKTTTFANGQSWTLRNGTPVRVK